MQLRLKDVSDDAWRRAIDALRPVAQSRDVAFLLNDRADLVARAGCDGVHVGQEDMPARQARALTGPDLTLGVTCKGSRDLAMQAGEDGADYVAFGAFFPVDDEASNSSRRARAPASSRRRRRAPLISLVSVPLRMKTRLLGWIAVASFTKQKRFNEGNRKLLSIVGSRAAAAIENARLYEDLRATFQQTIHGLARAIDKMDRYTAGHSERVATYATYLAVRLGLPPTWSRSSARAR